MPRDTPKSTIELLATPLSSFPDISPERATLLEKLGLRSVRDVLFCFPRDYEDFSDMRPVDRLEEGVLQTVRGTVTEVDSRGGFGKTRVGIIVTDDQGGAVRATWFNQFFMRDKFQPGQRVQLSAKPRMKGLRWEMTHPRVAWLDTQDGDPDDGLLPVYPLTEGLSLYHRRRVSELVVEQFSEVPEEVFSAELLAEHGLLPLREALPQLHFPKNERQRDLAQRRFVFQELFILQLALSARRLQQQLSFTAPPLPVDAKIDARITRLLPFELTSAQRRAISEISDDMARDTPMNRLLQGDVGSGKTAVAVYAMLLCVAHGKQAVLMAPTEVLARQHAITLDKLLSASRVRYRLLVGGQGEAERAEVLEGLAAGEVDLAIGTHAVLQEKVQFANLGLAVIDEQHKFGVRQRAALRSGKHSPHYLVMTATPIPRTMAMTQFGDLEVSTLAEAPAGRQPVSTYLVDPDQHDRWWNFVGDKLREGRQAYVVAPLVEESENVSAASVQQEFDRLTEGHLADFRVALLHGRMPPAEKEAIMNRFRTGATQVLVSTTVIEVGVDVPNASVMVIASPERFGLSQLHQLRGRVGRGGHPGFCAVIPDAELSDAARERLEAFASTTNGFELAELDFQLRGPGELFGDRQSGLPPMRIADLQRDRETLEEAREAARALFASDPGLRAPEHQKLRKQMLYRYGDALALGDVG